MSRKAHRKARFDNKQLKRSQRAKNRAEGKGFFQKIGNGLSAMMGGRNEGEQEFNYNPSSGYASATYEKQPTEIQQDDDNNNIVTNNDGINRSTKSVQDIFGNIKVAKIGIQVIIIGLTIYLVKKLLTKNK